MRIRQCQEPAASPVCNFQLVQPGRNQREIRRVESGKCRAVTSFQVGEVTQVNLATASFKKAALKIAVWLK